MSSVDAEIRPELGSIGGRTPTMSEDSSSNTRPNCSSTQHAGNSSNSSICICNLHSSNKVTATEMCAMYDARAWLNTEERSVGKTRTLAKAVQLGYLEVLRLVRAQGGSFDKAAMCATAARYGHLDVLTWLRQLSPPCPWDEMATYHAAAEGHLHVLEWLRAQVPPCPWDDACTAAAEGGHLATLQWMRAQVPPCDWSACMCLREAERRGEGETELVQWLLTVCP
jgi:hypothetical protein